MSELVKIDFHGDTLEAVEKDGQIWVSIRRVSESLGLNPDSQRIKLLEKDWACTAMITVQLEDGQGHQLAFIDLESLPIWLATIDSKRTKPQLQDRLRLYQKEAKTVLANHFLGRKPPEPLLTPAEALLRSCQVMVDHERRLAAIEKNVLEMKTAQLDAAQALLALPAPPVAAPEKPSRARLNRRIKEFAQSKGGGTVYSLSWHVLFREIYDRKGVDVLARVRNSRVKKRPIDIIDELGLLDEADAIAHEIFR